MITLDKIKLILLHSFGIALISFATGNIPFLTTSAFYGVLNKQGFAESFSKDSLFSIYSNSFGYPVDSPLSFGLPLVKVSSILTKFQLSAADSYTISFLLFIILAYFGANKWCGIYLNKYLSSIVSILWFCQPIVWYHVQYTALSIGIALIPLYTYIIYKFIEKKETSLIKIPGMLFLVFSTFVFSAFMDGYTFVMIALFSVISWVFLSMLEVDKLGDSKFVKNSIYKLFFLLFSISCSALLFNLYFPGVIESNSPLDFYRGWGVDLSFLSLPTSGNIWFFDILTIGVERNHSMYFGDSSVYLSTFVLPLLIFSFFGFFIKTNKKLFMLSFFTVAIFSLYMALGPSLKVNALRPEYLNSQLMPSEFGILSTGNGYFYQFLPGFKSMRATYRWIALFAFCLWIISINIFSSKYFKERKLRSYVIALVLIAVSFPNLSSRLEMQIQHREQIIEIENSLSNEISEYFTDDQIAIFVPIGNSVYANFLASTGGYKTYNVGGDKNVILSEQEWPLRIKKIKQLFEKFESITDFDIYNNLENDIIILPNFSINIGQDGKKYIEICYKTLASSDEYDECLLNNELITTNNLLLSRFENSDLIEIYQHDMFSIIKNKSN